MRAAPTISVLIPTVGTRPGELLDVIQAFQNQHGDEVEVLSHEGGSWGNGLNILAQRARGSFWLTCCDDTVPHKGWLAAALPVLESQRMPASRYLHPDGSGLHAFDELPDGEPLSWTRSFLLTAALYEQVGPFIDTTWWADVDYSERLLDAGWPIVTCDGYTFTHLPTEREWLTPEREQQERETYEARRRPGLERVTIP